MAAIVKLCNFIFSNTYSMLSVHGTYDGKNLRLSEKLNIQSPKKVIITFLDDEDDTITSNELHLIAEKGGGLNFLQEEEELYSDKDLKTKY